MQGVVMNPLRSAIVVLALCAPVGAQVPTTKTVDDPEIVRLKAENKMLQVTLEQRNKELVALREEIRTLKAQLARAIPAPAPATQPAQKSVAKKVVVPANFKLPDKTFSQMAVGQIGHIRGLTILRVIDEDTALVQVSEYPPGDINPGVPVPVLTNTFILEGITTKGMADGQDFNIDIFVKVVETRKVDGEARFIAWPVVKEGRAPQGRK